VLYRFKNDRSRDWSKTVSRSRTGSIVEFREDARQGGSHGRFVDRRPRHDTSSGPPRSLPARTRSIRRFPKDPAAGVGGYNLDEFVTTKACAPGEKSHGRLRGVGRSGVILEAKGAGSSPLPKPRAVMGHRLPRFAVVSFSEGPSPIALDPQTHNPLLDVEVMTSYILGFFNPQNANSLRPHRSRNIGSDPAATLCVEFYAGTRPTRGSASAPRAWNKDLRAKNFGYFYKF